MLIHVVKRGETLWSISNIYGVTMNQIITINQLENPNLLMVGQALVIPVNNDFHIVRPGETLWSIARRYGVTIEALMLANGIVNPNVIFVGQVIHIPKPAILVNGYLTIDGEDRTEVIEETKEYLTYISMFSYRIQADGGLIPIEDDTEVQLSLESGILPLMTITNFGEKGFDSDLAHAVLSSIEVQERLFANMINIMREKGYRGINIDFEYVFPYDRELYNQFLRRIVERMHANGYIVSTALAPKISADQRGLLYEAHDYPAHGQLADLVILMTYEWGWAGGPPLAVAPVNEVRKVLDYAVTVIPRWKILMGMPLYGRDWKLPYVRGTTIAATITPKEALRRAIEHRSQIFYNDLYQTPYFYYTDQDGNRHEVWFEDARSYQAKYNIVKEYGLRGVSYWELNLESPQNWPVLAHNFRTQKYL